MNTDKFAVFVRLCNKYMRLWHWSEEDVHATFTVGNIHLVVQHLESGGATIFVSEEHSAHDSLPYSGEGAPYRAPIRRTSPQDIQTAANILLAFKAYLVDYYNPQDCYTRDKDEHQNAEWFTDIQVNYSTSDDTKRAITALTTIT